MSGAAGELWVYGAGGHGLVVADAATAAGFHILGFIDDEQSLERVSGRQVMRASDLSAGVSVVVAIGDNAIRQQVAARVLAQRCQLVSVIHPSACVSSSASLGRGVYIGPQAVVNPRATLGDGVIVNSGAIVEHDCRIGAYAHVAPGAALGGQVCVGELSLVGVNAAVRPKVRIGSRVVVGAGAAVVRDIDDGLTVVGVPAEPL